MAKIKLGDRYRDEITGFAGVVVARYEFLYGCVRYALEGPNHENKPEEKVFDEQRLVKAENGKKPSPRATSGGPYPSPPSRPTP